MTYEFDIQIKMPHPPDRKLWEDIGKAKNTPLTPQEKIDMEKRVLAYNQSILVLDIGQRDLYVHKEDVPVILKLDIKWMKKIIKNRKARIAYLEKRISKD